MRNVHSIKYEKEYCSLDKMVLGDYGININFITLESFKINKETLNSLSKKIGTRVQTISTHEGGDWKNYYRMGIPKDYKVVLND